MQGSLYDFSDLSKPIGAVEIEGFQNEFNKDLVWQVVNSTRYQRITTKNTKNRSAVRGGGKKPWRQKGTGRARAGTSRSPIWVGGGVTFSHSSRVCSHKINKKMYKKAITVILSELFRRDAVTIVKELKLDSHKTKDLVNMIGPKLSDRKILILTDKLDENFFLASKNLYQIAYSEWHLMDPDILCDSNSLIITENAFAQIKEWLS